MNNERAVSTFFGGAQAAAYDQRWARMAPMAEALHFLTGAALSGLPERSRLLCVGAGTGAELLALAKAFPGWRFTAVEPSGAMLEVCRGKVEAAGLASRCEFHEGYLDTLPPSASFDGATAILVSQFLTDVEARRAFFRGIAARLRPGGLLVDAELAAQPPLPANRELLRAWAAAHGAPDPGDATPPGWGTDVAVSAPRDIEALIESAGFESPTLFHQALFIHAWFARVPGTSLAPQPGRD